jgi:hypothetical protein
MSVLVLAHLVTRNEASDMLHSNTVSVQGL